MHVGCLRLPSFDVEVYFPDIIEYYIFLIFVCGLDLNALVYARLPDAECVSETLNITSMVELALQKIKHLAIKGYVG